MFTLEEIRQKESLHQNMFRQRFAKDLSIRSELIAQYLGLYELVKRPLNKNMHSVFALLGTRMVNNCLSAEKLLDYGYYAEAAMVVRGMLETLWLIELLLEEPDKIHDWFLYQEIPVRTGRKWKDSMDWIYKNYCEVTHPDYAGNYWYATTRPKNHLKVGPEEDLTNAIMLSLILTICLIGLIQCLHGYYETELKGESDYKKYHSTYKKYSAVMPKALNNLYQRVQRLQAPINNFLAQNGYELAKKFCQRAELSEKQIKDQARAGRLKLFKRAGKLYIKQVK